MFPLIAGLFGLLMSSPPNPVQPILTAPVTRQVVQRNPSNNTCSILVKGFSQSPFNKVQVSTSVVHGGTSFGWTDVVSSAGSGTFSGYVTIKTGQYDLLARVVSGGVASPTSTISRVGCGVVFIAAGQSLMASWGQTVNTPTDDRVSEGNLDGTWKSAKDPQQTASPGGLGMSGNGGGSMIPFLGSSLAVHLNMPVGFYDVAVGNTSASQWISTYYASNLLVALHLVGLVHVEGILWEQGNADYLDTSSQYEGYIQTLIARSRADTAWNIPWGIAVSTYTSGNKYPDVEAAQTWLGTPSNITGGNTFIGGNTDSLDASYHFDTTHLNSTGQSMQAGLWYTQILSYFSGKGVPGY